jgi:PilZ domain
MPPEGVRRSTRIPKEIAILLTGSDTEGKVFFEETKTVLLSRYGAGIVSQQRLYPEQELNIRRLDTNKEAEVRVVGQIGSQVDTYTYGVAFLDPNILLWSIEFPLLMESERQARQLVLECSSCHSRETFDQSDFESDVFVINESIVRYCKRCGNSTIWKRASGAADDKLTSPEPVRKPEPSASATPAPVAVTPKPSVRPENKRKHVRTKANFKACVRQSEFDEDIVTCEDISRGGLRFKSRKRYVEGSMIEIAVPYSLGSPSIFVSAQIVRVRELPAEKLFQCGVAYISSFKNP